MAKNSITRVAAHKTVQKPLTSPAGHHLADTLFIMAYLVAPVLVYGFPVLDTNGPKFLVLSVLNMLLFTRLIFVTQDKRPGNFWLEWVKNPASLALLLFLFFSFISIVKATNVTESVMTLARTISVVLAVAGLWMLLKRQRTNFNQLIVLLNILLLFDSLSVFYNLFLFISGEIGSIMDIRSVYSHKNVLSAALFLKLPAAIYLIFFERGKLKWLGYIAAIMAIISILGLSARAFYLGLGIYIITMSVLLFFRLRNRSDSRMTLRILWWIGLVIAAVVIYSVVQIVLFPKDKDPDWNRDIVSRLATIRPDESSTKARFDSWAWSVKLFAKDPILGVGVGNWKVRVLEYENQVAPEFHYSIKAHNDFLENLVETGILGGLAFIAVFSGAILTFFRLLRLEKEGNRVFKLIFIPAFGLLGYMVDAFFNFPADRPEIQALFVVYLAWLLFVWSNEKKEPDQIVRADHEMTGNQWLSGRIPLLFILTVTFWTTWAFSQNVRSLYYQLASRQEVYSGVFSKNADYFLKGYPAMPNLTCLGEPITVSKARYLILEKRYPEAISLLKNDRTSPFDSRCDYYLSLIYDRRGMTDSAIYWARTAFRKQPLYGGTVLALSGTLYREGNKQEATAMLGNYIRQYPYNPKAFLIAAKWYFREGKAIEAYKTLAAGSHVINTDTAVAREVPVLMAMIKLYPFHIAYDSAKRLMNAGKYPEALAVFDLIVKKKPRFIETYTFRALCFSKIGKYKESIKDINHAILGGLKGRYDLINLRGVNKHKMGNVDGACRDFKKAMDNGNAQAASNYQRFCLKK